MSDLNTEIKLTASADGVETGVARAKRSLADLGATAAKTGSEGGKGMAPIGEGADAAARKVDAATRSMQNSLQRQIAALEAGGTATRQYQESLAKLRGVDASALKPLLDQLDAARAKADGAGQGFLGLGSASSLLQGQLAALAGSLTLGSMAAFVLQINNGIDALNDIKDATGSTIENISALEDVGKRTGASLDLVGGILIKFNDVLSKAGPKSDIALQLQAIGLSAEELKRLDPAEALLKTSKALQQYADDGNKARLVQDLFGKSVKDAAPFLNDLAEKGQLVAKVTTAQAEQAEKFNKELFAMQANVQEASRKLAGPMVSSLLGVQTAFRETSGEAISFSSIADGLGSAFELVAVLGANVAYTLKATGTEIGVIAAQAAAVAKGEFSEAAQIGRIWRADAERARADIDALTDRILNAKNRVQASVVSAVGSNASAGSDDRPPLNPPPTAAEIAAAEAAARAAAQRAAAARERELAEQAKFYADMAGLSADYYDKLARAQQERAAGNISEAQYVEYVEQLIQKQPFATALTRDNAKALKDQNDAKLEASKASVAYYAALGQDLTRLDEQNERLRQESEQFGLTAEGLLALTLARQDHAIAIESERLSLLQANEGSTAEILLSQRRIALLKEQRTLTATNGQRQIAADAAKDAAKEWERTSQQIEQSLTDALMRGFESGKGFAEVLRNTVVNMFKTMVLRPVIQATVQGGLNAVGFAGAGASRGGLIGQAAIGNYGAGASTYALRTGDWLATSSSDSLADMGTWLQTNSEAIGKFANVAGDVLGYANALNTALSRNAQGGKDYGAAIGQAIGQFFGGPLGSAIGGSIGKALGIVDYGGTLHEGGAAQFSAAEGLKTSANGNDFGLSFHVAQGDYGAKIAATTAATVAGLLENAASTFGTKAGYTIATAFADDISPDDGAWGALMVSLGDRVLLDWKGGQDKWPGREFSNGEAGAKEYAAAVALDVRNLLIEQTPDWADAMLTALGDAPTIESLAATVGQINAAASALDAMGQASQAFANLGEDAAGALITALGDAEAAVANLGGYYGNFYTEAERAAIATQQLTGQLSEMGVALPASREAFRALVDAALAAGDTTLAAGLISLQDEFAALVPAAQAVSDAISNTLRKLQEDGQALRRELLLASGGDVRAFDTAGFTEAELAAYDYNAALRAQIQAMVDAQAAAEAATQKTQELAQQAADASRQSAATMLGALEQVNQFFDGFQRSITSFVAGLDAQAGGLPGLRSAGAAYSSQLAFARGGDQDALQGITGYAQTYIDAIRRESTTAAEAALQVGRVRGQLLALPGQVKPEDAIVAALGALGETLTASFDNIDLNIDGLIDYAEFGRTFDGMASDATLKEIFRLMDTNGDGTISRLEAIKGTSLQTAENTYGLDKLSRVKDVIDSLDWGTAGWDASSTRAFATVASQQGWTAQDVAQALNGRFTPEQLQQFFAQYGQNLALGGLTGISSTATGSSAATAASAATGSGFVVGGGSAGASAGTANYGGAGDIQTVFAQAYINSLDWGTPQADASSTAALASYAGSAGLSQADLADLLGFTPEQIQQHFAAYGIPAFAVGTNYVPRDMLAMIHEGEAVVPKAYNPVAGGMDFSAFGRGIEAMAAEVRALREDNRAQARTVVSLLQRQVKLEERWDANGLPSTRVEA